MIVSSMEPGRDHQDDDLTEDEGHLEAFADDLISAIKASDAKGVAEAIKALFLACNNDDGADEGIE